MNARVSRLLASACAFLTASAFAHLDSLPGKWSAQCSGISQGYSKISIDYSDDSMLTVYELFHDPFCRMKMGTLTVEAVPIVGTLSKAHRAAYEFDVILRDAVLRPSSAATTLAMNTMKFCGMDGWRVGIARSVTGKDCGSKGKIPAVGERISTLIALDEAGKSLCLGKFTAALNGSSDENRPRELETNAIFHRSR